MFAFLYGQCYYSSARTENKSYFPSVWGRWIDMLLDQLGFSVTCMHSKVCLPSVDKDASFGNEFRLIVILLLAINQKFSFVFCTLCSVGEAVAIGHSLLIGQCGCRLLHV